MTGLRILYLNHNLREHGTYFRALDIARALARRGHEGTLLTASPRHWYRPGPEEEIDGVRVVETPSWNPLFNCDDGWGPLDLAYRLWRVMAEEYDLLYAFAHPPTVYFPTRLAALARRKPVVADWCDAYRDGLFAWRETRRDAGMDKSSGARLWLQRRAEAFDARLERRVLRKARAVTVISEQLERDALAAGVARDRLLRFPSGANLAAFGDRDKAACRGELGVEGEGPFLGYTANYNPDEELFLQALARVAERMPSVRLIAACPRFSAERVARLGLSENLIELGLLPFAKMPVVLGACDALALPLEENAMNRARWPNKFGDYLAAARPVVSCAVGDIARYFPEDGADDSDPIGRACACQPEALANALIEVLSTPEKWDAMGRAARRVAETRLNWDAFAEQIEALIAPLARSD